MSASANVHRNGLEASGFRGEVIQPDDSSYEAARRVWNGMIDRRPAIIARCAEVDDVVAALRFAQSHDLLVAVRGGGHNLAGYGTCDGGIVIDLSTMQSIRVDPGHLLARAEGGATWGQLDRATQRFGLATPSGVVSTTGIAGLTLGGGYGWLSRCLGATVDNLVSAELVSADGRLLKASVDENPDLFWGLRGAGAGLGIVTSFEYRLHPVGPTIYGGFFVYPIEQALEVLGFCREWMPQTSDELSTAALYMVPSPFDPMPAELNGKPMVLVYVCYSGRVADGEKAITELRDFGKPVFDYVAPLPYTAWQAQYDPGAPHGICAYWKTGHFNELSDDVIRMSVAKFVESPSSQSLFILEELGGAITRRNEGDTAFSYQGEAYRFNIEALWWDPREGAANIAWARDFQEALTPYSSGTAYFNYLGEEEDDVAASFEQDKRERLLQLKRTYDPGDVFTLNRYSNGSSWDRAA